LTVAETWLLGQVLQDKAGQDQDQTLLPHFADEAKEEMQRQLDRARAYDALSPAAKLDLAQELYD
jgi:hypothetical protein